MPLKKIARVRMLYRSVIFTMNLFSRFSCLVFVREPSISIAMNSRGSLNELFTSNFGTFEMVCAYSTTCNSKHKYVHLQPCAASKNDAVFHFISSACLGVQQKSDGFRYKENCLSEGARYDDLYGPIDRCLYAYQPTLMHRILCMDIHESDHI